MSPRARTLGDLGESALIERIKRRSGVAPSQTWPLTIGDDAAILRPRAGFDLVLSTDAQIENVHFKRGRETPRVVGRRALAVNLSDLAAMGATPVGCLLSLALPRNLELAEFDDLVSGFVDESKRYACPLVGGNLARSEDCSLHVTVVGRVSRGAGLRRARIRVGDELFVTGVLGAAALARRRADRLGSRLWRVPTPRIDTGVRLSRLPRVTACIDLSDGLITDLGHLLGSSGLGAEVDLSALPSPKAFARECASMGLDPAELMVSGGEDYELLFTRRPTGRKLSEAALERRLGVRISRIGRIVERPGLHGLPPGLRREHHF